MNFLMQAPNKPTVDKVYQRFLVWSTRYDTCYFIVALHPLSVDTFAWLYFLLSTHMTDLIPVWYQVLPGSARLVWLLSAARAYFQQGAASKL